MKTGSAQKQKEKIKFAATSDNWATVGGVSYENQQKMMQIENTKKQLQSRKQKETGKGGNYNIVFNNSLLGLDE